MATTTTVPARIIEVNTTRNGYLIEQVVRSETNGSRYRLVGIEMLRDGKVGDCLTIAPMSGGYAKRVHTAA